MGRRGQNVVVLIGIFKLVKAALLIALGLAGLFELQRDLGHVALRAVAWMGGFAGRQTVVRMLGHLWTLDRRTAERWGALSLGYAAIFLTEGVGLLLQKRWAEWLTVVITASFVPFEIYELIEKFSSGKILALALNVAIVIYLVLRRMHERHGLARIRQAMPAL